MARHRTKSRRYRTRSRRHRMRGGAYSSASTYGMYVAGSGNEQYDRVFNQGGAYGSVPSNNLIGTGGQGVTPSSQMPTAGQLSLIQKAGKRRRGGGFLGEAIVPLTLLGMQQTYRRKRGGKRGTRRH